MFSKIDCTDKHINEFSLKRNESMRLRHIVSYSKWVM